MRKNIIVGVVAVGLLFMSNSQSFAQAEAGVPSLIIPPGARANGMGETYVALANDATAGWWNAGGLAFVQGNNLAFMHSQLVPDLASDVYYEYLGYAKELPDVGVFSIALIYLTYGESVATDPSGNALGTFNSWEGALQGSFAIPLTENLGAGVSMKFILVDYAPGEFTVEGEDGKGSSFAADAGILYKMPNQKLNFGLSLANAGPDIAFVDREQSDPLPWTARLGVSYMPIQDEISQVTLAYDLEQSLVWLVDSGTDRRRSEIHHVGAEYLYSNLIALRTGYVYDEDGDFSDFTYGFGIVYKRLALDYANVPQAEQLDRVDRWSFYVNF